MSHDEDARMKMTSTDLLCERTEGLRELVPEAFSEGRIDFDRLRIALGDDLDPGPERYGLTWAGKAEAMRSVQIASTGTLLPVPDESVNFDSTQNVFIEGENLEVLKLLQRSYYGRVKLIYIDPPYNTGNDFVYPDDFKDGLQQYLRLTGQLGEAGSRLTTNAETSGRYHSNWLSMMYPRLLLARNLLRDDGVVFVSIDDNEVHNLRHLMDEIFGPENFVATVIWQKVFSPKNTAKHFSADHDFVVVYARNAEQWRPGLLPRTKEMEARYSNPTGDPRGPWASSDMCARNFYGEGTYSVECPSGRIIDGPPTGSYWRVSKRKFAELDLDGRIWWGDDGDNMPRLKRFLSEVKAGRVPQTLWTYQEVGHTQEAKKELLARVEFESSDSVFNTPKPTRLIERILRLSTEPTAEDIVLDFFAGSGATGDAVLQLNRQDGGNRRFVLVQLPEPVDSRQLPTIAEMAKGRLRAAIRDISKESSNELDFGGAKSFPLGVRVFRLASSCFRAWSPEKAPLEPGALGDSLTSYTDHVVKGRGELEILYELMLKAGLPLTASLEEKKLPDGKVYWVDGGALAVCLERKLSQALLRALMELRPRRVICLDLAFQGNDQLKVNTVLEARSHDIQFQTV